VAKHETPLRGPGSSGAHHLHDGTSQRARVLPALDPGSAPIDERGPAELLEFVQALVRHLRWFELDESSGDVRADGTWSAFAGGRRVKDIVAYMAEPERVVDEETRRWMSRPHFALLLAFVELLGEAREELGRLTRRHLDYHYRDVLGMQPFAAEPDRLAVVFTLTSRVAQHRLPAGTALSAGRDAAGVARTYRTERDLFLSPARIDMLRSVYVERSCVTLRNVRKQHPASAFEAFAHALRIALGDGVPGDEGELQGWLVDLFKALLFAPNCLNLRHHELRRLMRLVRSRRSTDPELSPDAATAEWSAIRGLLERAGRRRTHDPSWQLVPKVEDFTGDLRKATGTLPAWPRDCASIDEYEQRLRAREIQYGLSVERQLRLCQIAVQCAEKTRADEVDETTWRELEQLLEDAHRERFYAARRARLDEARGTRDDRAGFDAMVAFVRERDAKPWPVVRDDLAGEGRLEIGHLDLLDRAYEQLERPAIRRADTWADVERVLEFAWRNLEDLREPPAAEITHGDLCAREIDPTVAPFRLAGAPAAGEQPRAAEAVSLGWAICSPRLALSQGKRTLTLTLGFAKSGFDAAPLDNLGEAWRFEVSTARGWLELPIAGVTIGEDYWASCEHVRPDGARERPALQFKLVAGASREALAPLPGTSQPMLRATLREPNPRAFASLELQAVHLSIDATELELLVHDAAAARDPSERLLHVHPFGVAPLDPQYPRLCPRYEYAGELYIGLCDVTAPRRLSLLFQLVPGSADPDLEPPRITWWYLDGDHWCDLHARGGVLHDSTLGLRSSGSVELALPSVAPSTLLPEGHYWLRVTIDGEPAGACAVRAIRPHGVIARFDDRGNAPDHYAAPLAPGSVERMLEPDARVAKVEQPFSSFGGKPAERTETFYTRVSEQLRHKQRALTAWDYERLVLQRFGEIYKAKCLTAGAGGGAPGQVDVVVIPDVRNVVPRDTFAPMVSSDLLGEIATWLRRRAPDCASVRVRNARYVPVKVRVSVRFKPEEDATLACARLNEELIRFMCPWAYADDAEVTIGGRIYANSILDFIDRREYVDYAAAPELTRDGRVIPRAVEDYHVAAQAPDEVLVSAEEHQIDVIAESGYQQHTYSGIGYMRIAFDFVVAPAPVADRAADQPSRRGRT
jgi:hypothetical protein